MAIFSNRKIKTSFNLPNDEYDAYLTSIEVLLKRLVPKEIYDEEKYDELDSLVPLLHATPLIKSPTSLGLSLLCHADYTHGTGRYVCDMCSRWLIPGKQLPIVTVRSMGFTFIKKPEQKYFINEIVIEVLDDKDIQIINNNLDALIDEIRLCILAVQHARKIVISKPLTLPQKKILIDENISSLMNRRTKDFDVSIFDEMQHLLNKASAERKVTQIKELLAPLIELKPKAFDRDIFTEIQHFVLLFRENFTALRDLKHIYKIISYQYLFRKDISHAMKEAPKKRLLSIKLLKTTIRQPNKEIPVLGVLVTINLINENEVFEEKHLIRAIQSYLSDVSLVKDSYVLDRRGTNRIRTLYLEVKKTNKKKFTNDEIKGLQSNLLRELKGRIESVFHPIFMYRNEEEIMRSILTLSDELKYVHDIPQAVINFHEQTADRLSFTVILLRLLKKEDQPIKDLFESKTSYYSYIEHDVKLLGTLKKRYPKEANVFEIRLQKQDFLRNDFSLNIYKARNFITAILTEKLGEIRDFNGGMMLKQDEVLNEIKDLLLAEDIKNDFLLENFFYSISPPYMQSLLPSHLLKIFFEMLLEVLSHDFQDEMYFAKTEIIDDTYLIILGATDPSFMEFLNTSSKKVDIGHSELVSSFVNIYDIQCIGYLLRFDEKKEYEELNCAIISSMEKWKESMDETPSSFTKQKFLNLKNALEKVT